MTGKPFLQRLDDLANRTGVPQLAAWPAKRRPLRGLAIAALGLGTIGLAIMVIDARLFWIGDAVLMVGFLISVWLPIVGPIKPWLSTDERVDERDSAIRANAYLAALPAILLAAIAGLAGLPALGWMQHRTAPEMVGLGGFAAIYLVVLWNAVPTLHASWQRQPADEDD
jgi:hypothetical protein